jgi:hypothetical protein
LLSALHIEMARKLGCGSAAAVFGAPVGDERPMRRFGVPRSFWLCGGQMSHFTSELELVALVNSFFR